MPEPDFPIDGFEVGAKLNELLWLVFPLVYCPGFESGDAAAGSARLDRVKKLGDEIAALVQPRTPDANQEIRSVFESFTHMRERRFSDFGFAVMVHLPEAAAVDPTNVHADPSNNISDFLDANVTEQSASASERSCYCLRLRDADLEGLFRRIYEPFEARVFRDLNCHCATLGAHRFSSDTGSRAEEWREAFQLGLLSDRVARPIDNPFECFCLQHVDLIDGHFRLIQLGPGVSPNKGEFGKAIPCNWEEPYFAELGQSRFRTAITIDGGDVQVPTWRLLGRVKEGGNSKSRKHTAMRYWQQCFDLPDPSKGVPGGYSTGYVRRARFAIRFINAARRHDFSYESQFSINNDADKLELYLDETLVLNAHLGSDNLPQLAGIKAFDGFTLGAATSVEGIKLPDGPGDVASALGDLPEKAGAILGPIRVGEKEGVFRCYDPIGSAGG